jgi:hypothetical protein
MLETLLQICRKLYISAAFKYLFTRLPTDFGNPFMTALAALSKISRKKESISKEAVFKIYLKYIRNYEVKASKP